MYIKKKYKIEFHTLIRVYFKIILWTTQVILI